MSLHARSTVSIILITLGIVGLGFGVALDLPPVRAVAIATKFAGWFVWLDYRNDLRMRRLQGSLAQDERDLGKVRSLWT